MGSAETSLSFALQKITTEQFAIIEDGFQDKGNIKIGINLRFAADNEQKLVSVFTAFTFEQNQKPFIVIEAGCHFRIEEKSWLQMHNDQEHRLVISKGLLSHLAMLTVGTTRGILHAKTENTCFNKYILPTINVVQLIKENVVVEFNEERNQLT